MKTTRITEAIDLINYTGDHYVNALIKKAVPENCMRISKEEQAWALNECFDSLICDLTIARLDEEKVSVWNRDPANPEYIDVTIEEALKDTLDGLLARSTKKVHVNNATAKVNDLVLTCIAYVKNL